MKVMVRVNVERRVRNEPAKRPAERDLTSGDTVRIVLEQAIADRGPDFGALVPSPITVAAVEAARRDWHLGRGDHRTHPARLQTRRAGIARRRIRRAGGCPHRSLRVARAVTHGRLLGFLFWGRCPSGPGSRAPHRAPAKPGLGPSGFDPYRGRLGGLMLVRGSLGCAVAAQAVANAGASWQSRGDVRSSLAAPKAVRGRRCEGVPATGRSPALADQLGVRQGRRIVVPDELPRKHHALDAVAVGEHGAEEVGCA